MSKSMNSRRGILLVFIILSLILLILVAIIFASLAKTEVTSVINFIKKRKSLFLSESGFHYATVKLLTDIKNSNILSSDWQFMGEDINKNGRLDGNEDYNKNGVLDITDIPLDTDSSVSYQFRKDGKGEVVNPHFSYALTSGEEYGIFKLKITDEASKININYGNLLDPKDSSNANLQRILNILGAEIGINNLGERIISVRPTSGFTQLEELIDNVLNYDEFQRVRYYITTFSYGTSLLKYRNSSVVDNNLKEGTIVYALSDIYPKNIEKEIRHFININTAPYAVLVAVLADLSGYYLDGTNLEAFNNLALAANKEGVKHNNYTSVPIGILRKTKPITIEQARKIAKEIIQKRIEQPFVNFYGENEWDGFLNKLVSEKVIDLYQKETLRANFNPNVNSFLWNPDLPLRFLVDKFLLTTTSFEWTFFPTGSFTIESIGEIFTKDKIVSKTYTQKFVKLWDISFLSTQQDFAGPNFEYLDKSLYKANIKYTTRSGYELDIYPFMYPYEKKASDFTGYIGLSTISLPLKSVAVTYKKKDKNIEIKPFSFISFNTDTKAEEPKTAQLLKSYEDLPQIFTDGAYSDTKRTIRLGDIKSPKFDTTVVDPNKEPVVTGESYPVPVSIQFFRNNLTISSDKLLGFLEELKIKDEDIFTSMGLSMLAGVSIKDLKNKKLTLFLPHSCCFWDVYWSGGGGGGIHFYVPKHAEELIEKYFPPDVIGALEELCNNSELMTHFASRLGQRGIECPLAEGTIFYSFGFYFWHKGNWINKEAIYPLISYGRVFQEKVYGKNQTSIKAEPDATDEELLNRLVSLYNKKNRFHSAMIQDFYFALPFIDKGKLFRKNRAIMYLDLATPNRNIITDKERPFYYNYKYLSSYTISNDELKLEEGKWNHIGIFFGVKFIKEEDKNDSTKFIVKNQLFKSGIFKNGETLPTKTRFLHGDLQNLNDTDTVEGIEYIGENIAKFYNPGIRFGEYIKRGYAKTDRPIFDPYLSGFITSQSTYDEIYIYKFDEEALKEGKPKEISDILFKAGRYYPLGGTLTIESNLWGKLAQDWNFIGNQIHYYIPPTLQKICSIDESLSISKRSNKLPLTQYNTNIFTANEYIYIKNIKALNIHINCKANPPLLETPFIDSIMLVTSSGIKEVISAKEGRDISY